jgi:hypothetical protein
MHAPDPFVVLTPVMLALLWGVLRIPRRGEFKAELSWRFR